MFESDFFIQYVDIDYKNELSDYGIIKHLQEIACLHADKCKLGLNDTKSTRLAWIILDWKIKIFYRPGWNTKINIKTWISKVDTACCYRDFKITDENGTIIAMASSRWVLLNIDLHRISKMPNELFAAAEPINKTIFDDVTEKFQEPETFENVFDYTVLRRDIDTNNHLNNLNYVVLAKQALPENIYLNETFSQIQVSYKHQCLLNDKLSFCYYKSAQKEHIVFVKNKLTNITNAIVKFNE